ncbi:heme-dependent catalase [Eremomyces bilateralis CBS 781.70]|uniref:Heme-dependent catalase n=1 Tax=Eremomyces bilateralis CBS 781.70 TaxID=1392243 RepID=A0A6G1FXN2_9PEZI|nr:heme-dependent catalase [Eremomyces bilateralis CBS 781.70]KAF1810441.1 heme-dependent catalase [Eremomyces bilateralis CBS 781.70]
MPFSNDQAGLKTAEELLGLFHKVFGPHPGFRPAHARGLVIHGTFSPTPEAASLTTAPHFHAPSTPITARFSSSTGIPEIPDTDLNANPRGLAIRFNLGTDASSRRQHTDIIGHSTPVFPVKTGAEFLEFLTAVATSATAEEGKPKPIETFLGGHPAAFKFVTFPKPFPESFANEAFYMLNAFKFIDQEGKETFVRYQVQPVEGLKHLKDEEVAGKGPSYLFDELPQKLAAGPVEYKLLAQIAEPGDSTNDVTEVWPESRKLVKLGTVKLETVEEDLLATQKKIIFDPIPRVAGIEPSDDPILQFRADLYLLSGKERRAA